jgi:succinate dehydrogenase / fumarate reductase membrane anchor subunit
MSPATQLRKVRGLGSAHAGTGHFLWQRITAILLIPLTVWFAITAVGLSGVSQVSAMIFLSNPMHAILMGMFLLIALYHMSLGLQEIIVDYIANDILKLILLIADYGFAVIAGAAGVLFLMRIVL